MFLELAKERFSVRKYKDTPVEEEKLKQVLEAGRVAPSACNLQPWHFVVVRDPELKRKVIETYSSKYDWILTAPALIVVCGDHNKSWKREDGKDHCDIDIAISVDHMTLQAVELGLGTCWIAWFDDKKLSEILKLPYGIEPIIMLPIGYPVDGLQGKVNKRRNDFNQIVHWDKF